MLMRPGVRVLCSALLVATASRADTVWPVQALPIIYAGNGTRFIDRTQGGLLTTSAIAINGVDEGILVWSDFRRSRYRSDVFGSTFSATLAPLVPLTVAAPLASENKTEKEPDVACSTSRCLVVWEAQGIWVQSFTTALTPIDPVPTLIRAAPPGTVGQPKVAFEGATWAVVWLEGAVVRFQRLDPTGQVVGMTFDLNDGVIDQVIGTISISSSGALTAVTMMTDEIGLIYAVTDTNLISFSIYKQVGDQGEASVAATGSLSFVVSYTALVGGNLVLRAMGMNRFAQVTVPDVQLAPAGTLSEGGHSLDSVYSNGRLSIVHHDPSGALVVTSATSLLTGVQTRPSPFSGAGHQYPSIAATSTGDLVFSAQGLVGRISSTELGVTSPDGGSRVYPTSANWGATDQPYAAVAPQGVGWTMFFEEMVGNKLYSAALDSSGAYVAHQSLPTTNTPLVLAAAANGAMPTQFSAMLNESGSMWGTTAGNTESVSSMSLCDTVGLAVSGTMAMQLCSNTFITELRAFNASTGGLSTAAAQFFSSSQRYGALAGSNSQWLVVLAGGPGHLARLAPNTTSMFGAPSGFTLPVDPLGMTATSNGSDFAVAVQSKSNSIDKGAGVFFVSSAGVVSPMTALSATTVTDTWYEEGVRPQVAWDSANRFSNTKRAE